MDTTKEFTISEVINSFGVTKHTWVLFIILSLAQVFDGYDFMIVNSTNMFIAHTFWPDNPAPGALMGSLTTWGLLGMVIGGAVGGILSDKIGRKKTLILAVAFYGLFTLPQAFSNDLTFFAVFRMIAGFGVGSCIPIVYTYFAETVPSNRRGFFITCGGACMVGGWVIAGLVANPICNMATPVIAGLCEEITYVVDASGATATMYANWRVCYLIGALPVLYAVFLHFAMKETPHWYANAGRLEEAVAALKQIEKASVGTETDYDPSKLIIPPKPKKTSPSVLFSDKFVIGTVAVWSTYFVAQFTVYGMNAWLPTWFTGIGYSASDSVTLQTLNNVGAIIANSIVGYVSDTCGRKKTLIGGWIFCIAAICLCSVFVAPNSFWLCVALMVLFGMALNFAISAIVPLMPEQYPTAIRNTGTSWCQAFARFGGSASSIVLGGIAGMALFQVDGATNWSMVVLVLNVPFVLGLICTIIFVRESSGSLEALNAEAASEEKDTGTARFYLMMAIIVVLFSLCIVCPLAVQGWTKLPIALPLMACGMLLPFVFFFGYGGMALAKQKASKAQ